MTDNKVNVSVQHSVMRADSNGRIYPPEVMRAALDQARRDGTLDVRVDPDPVSGKSVTAPVQIGDKRFVNPKFTLVSYAMGEDGSLSGSFEVEELAGAVDRLADVARADEISSESSGPPAP